MSAPPATCAHCDARVFATYTLPDGTALLLCERHWRQTRPRAERTTPNPDREKK